MLEQGQGSKSQSSSAGAFVEVLLPWGTANAQIYHTNFITLLDRNTVRAP